MYIYAIKDNDDPETVDVLAFWKPTQQSYRNV